MFLSGVLVFVFVGSVVLIATIGGAVLGTRIRTATAGEADD